MCLHLALKLISLGELLYTFYIFKCFEYMFSFFLGLILSFLYGVFLLVYIKHFEK